MLCYVVLHYTIPHYNIISYSRIYDIVSFAQFIPVEKHAPAMFRQAATSTARAKVAADCTSTPQERARAARAKAIA